MSNITELFKNEQDYWGVAETIKELYMSDGSMNVILDFERVLDQLSTYAFKNWKLGELVSGPEINRYTVGCTFMWPEHLMPDPRGGKRLLTFGCTVSFKRSTIKVPIKVKSINDFRPNTKKPRLIDKVIWLVEIIMPKELMSDIQSGSIEFENQTIDLSDLDLAYDTDLDTDVDIDTTDDDFADEMDTQSEENLPFG